MILLTVPLSESTVKTRWLEPYVTAGLNQKALAGDTRGVVLGFRVVPDTGYIVTVQADPTLGLSIANVTDTSTEKYALTLVQAGDITLDLITWAGTTVYLALDAQYQLGTNSGAQLLVVDAAELSAPSDLIPIAKVAVPGSPPIVTTDINMGYRLSAGDSIPSDARPPFNLVGNGTFERDTAGGAPSSWKILAGASLSPTVDATVFRTGTKSLRLSSVGAVTGSFGTNFVPVEPGQIARASLWIRSSGGSPITGTGVTAYVVWFDLGFNQLSFTQLESAFTGGSTVFEQRQAEVTVPAGAAQAKIAINYVSCSGTLYVDDVQLLVRSGDNLTQSPVLAGNGVLADEFHAHNAAGLNYAGSAPDTWADLTTLPPGTVQDTFDNVVSTIGSASGAAKMGFTPATPVDLTTARVDLALNELDDKKAGLAQPNLFTRGNTFSPSTTPTTAVTANGTGATGKGVLANALGGADAVQGFAIGAGVGIYGNSPGGGVKGESTVGTGVVGNAIGTTIGAGVAGTAGTNNADFGTNTLNPPVPGPGNGGQFIGAAGAAGGDGIQAWGRGTTNSRTGVLGVGAFPTVGDTNGGAGGYFFGGTASGAGVGGNGVIGIAGAGAIAPFPVGVYGTGNGVSNAYGVRGLAGPSGVGVRGDSSTGFSSIGVQGYALATNTVGVYGTGVIGINATGVKGLGGGFGSGGEFTGGDGNGYGVKGFGVGAFAGVYGKGGSDTPGGEGVYGEGGSVGGNGVVGVGHGANGTGVVGKSSSAAFDPVPTARGVYGSGDVGVEGLSDTTGFGADGVRGFAGTSGAGVMGIGAGGTVPLNGAGVVAKGSSSGSAAIIAAVHGQTLTDADCVGVGVYGIGGTHAGVVGIKAGISVAANFAGTAGVAGCGDPAGYFRGVNRNGLVVNDGMYHFSGNTDPGQALNPLYTETAFHRMVSKSVIKAWVSAVGMAGAQTNFRVIDGFNISGFSRTGTAPNSVWTLTYQSGIGALDKSGVGDDTNGFALSGITVTFTKTGGSSFVAADLGRSIVITGSTTAANNSQTPSENFGEFVITAVLNANQVQYINAAAVNEAFPSATGVWTINETPYAASFMCGELSATHVTPYLTEQRRGFLKFVMRKHDGTRVDALDTLRLMIIVTGPQYSPA